MRSAGYLSSFSHLLELSGYPLYLISTTPRIEEAAMEAATDTLYTVALCDFPDLPVKERIAAEVRYCKALERRLGSDTAVPEALRAVHAPGHDGAGDGAKELLMRWRMATTAARTQGLQGVSDVAEAYFDVRLS
jgi:hypothetical protein